PVLTTLSPGSAAAGGAAFQLTVNGTGFVSGMTGNWNGAGRSTAFVSATQLVAQILSTDIAASGNASVVVGGSNALSFLITSSGVTVNVNLSWDAPNPAPPSYAIYRYVSGQPAVKAGTSTFTTASLTGVSMGSQYFVRGVATDGTESLDS